MSPNFDYATGTPVITSVLMALTGAIGIGGAAALAVPRIAERVMPKPRETRLSEFLPFQRIREDGMTVECRDGSLCRFFAISGIDQNFLKREEAASLFQARKQLFDALAEVNVNLRIYTMREPTAVPNETGFPNDLAEQIAQTWNQNFERAFITRTIVAVTVKGNLGEEALDDAQTVIESALSKYTPLLMTQNPETSPSGDLTIGNFLGRLSAPISRPSPRGFGDYLSDTLAADEVEFLPNGRIQFRSGDQVKYASVLGIRRLGDETTTDLANQLSSINAESTIFQTVEVETKTKALIKLKQNQKMMAAQSFSPDVATQYDAAIGLVEGLSDEKAALVFFSETVFLYGDTEEELAEAEREARQIFTNHGITTAIEKGASQMSWFMQFPTYEVKPRVYRLMSTNVAQLSTFDRPASGLPRSEWGEGPIARFFTGQNSVYMHQFHSSTSVGALGHGVVIAPTGAGKTVLLEFLSLMASRLPNLRQFFFDRYQGTYIYTTAMGGQYLSLNAEKQEKSVTGGLNPFQCDPTEDNIEFLKQWLQALVGTNNADAIEQISNAIDIAFASLDKEERSLAQIYEAAFTPGSEVAEALYKWVDPNQYGEIFNAEQDSLDLAGNWLTTFDMTQSLEDEVLAGPIVMYIMHRIRQVMKANRAPGLIVIDETEPLLRNEHFRKIFFIMLQEFRKLGGVVISVFQRPEALKAQGISELIRQQCGTYYLFPNPGAQETDYLEFGLTDREVSFIVGNSKPTRRVERGLLLKHPHTQDSVILDVNLKPLGRYLDVLSSTRSDVARANDLQKLYPENWVKHYIEGE